MSGEYENLRKGGDSTSKGDKDSRSPQAKRGTAQDYTKFTKGDVEWHNEDEKGSQPDPWRHLDANDGRATGWPA